MSGILSAYRCNRCGEWLSLSLPAAEYRDHDLPCSNCRQWNHSACNCNTTTTTEEDED